MWRPCVECGTLTEARITVETDENDNMIPVCPDHLERYI